MVIVYVINRTATEAVAPVPTCPGPYCGRTLSEEGHWSECGACPRGFRVNATSHCVPCEDEPILYDWLYLGFMMLLPLVLNWYFIDMTARSRTFRKQAIVQHICALVEVSAAWIIALVLMNPMGKLFIKVCSPRDLSDWYTLLHNPQPDYKETIHCTQEAVYPMQTLVLLMYTLNLVLMMAIRPWVVSLASIQRGKMPIYCALYFLPLLVFIHAVAAGIIYYSFPYIIIILSMMSSASHFSTKLKQTPSALLMSTVSDFRNTVIILGHWLLHAYGIVSITGMKDPAFHGPLLCLVPLPAIFYIVTVRFTAPHSILGD